MEISTLLKCQHCEQTFQPTNKRQRFCLAKCRAAANYLPTKQANEAARLAELPRKDAEFKARNRDMSLGFDGRYGGVDNLASLGDRIFPRLPYDQKNPAEWVRL